MCGIAGIFNFDGQPVSRVDLRQMCNAIAHRGPDDAGFHFSAGAGIGMRRLSIIDLSTGHQPISNEDGAIHVVFNGEIYNYRQLRHELEQRGHQFRTSTDTETIVHLYEEYGSRAVEHMRGMFAFAVWDERQRKLLLARDRLGIKPLYYIQLGQRLVFASELKAILQLPEVPVRLDWKAVQGLFTFLATPARQSIVEGVRKLEPGHVLVASASGGVRIEQYWDVEFRPDRSHDEEYFVERLRELLEESVRLRMISDVPVGAFLSGGVDSSSIVALMSRMSSGPIKTFSVGFNEEAYDEREHARLVAQRFGTDHHEQVLTPNALDIIDDLTWYMDEPFGDSSSIPTYAVSQLASRHVKVVLSGDGGDELFAGYSKYLVEAKEQGYDLLPRLLRTTLGRIGKLLPNGAYGRNFLRHVALDGERRYLDSLTLFRPDEQLRLFNGEALAAIAEHDPYRTAFRRLRKSGEDWLSNAQYYDLKSYLPLDVLTKVDRMSMAHSIEARVPLLDHKLVEFAATIPPELRLRDGRTKHVFKEAMRGILPDSILNRRKQGFGVPLGHWFRGKLGPFVRDLLLSDTSRQRGVLNPSYVERLIRIHEGGRPLDLQLWTLISFEMWCRTFLDGANRWRARRVGPAASFVA